MQVDRQTEVIKTFQLVWVALKQQQPHLWTRVIKNVPYNLDLH